MVNEIDFLSDTDLVEVETINPSNYQKINLIGANDVQRMELKPINWIIPNFLPEGLAIIAGRPKIGKSWLALNLSLAIARGGKALSYFDCNEHSILYLPYEDNFRRLQSRMNNILSYEDDKNAPTNLFYPENLEFPKLNDGGLEKLKEIITANTDIKVVIVDTLGRALLQKKSISNNQFLDDYNLGSEIQKFAMENQIAILLIHHTRKMQAENIFDEISGSTGITASPDSLFVLKKGNQSCILHTTGRDLPDNEYSLKFNSDSFTWKIEGLKEEIQVSGERQEILDLFNCNTELVLKTSEITSSLGKHKSTISQLLRRMESAGTLTSPVYGSYKLNDRAQHSFI